VVEGHRIEHRDDQLIFPRHDGEAAFMVGVYAKVNVWLQWRYENCLLGFTLGMILQREEHFRNWLSQLSLQLNGQIVKVDGVLELMKEIMELESEGERGGCM